MRLFLTLALSLRFGTELRAQRWYRSKTFFLSKVMFCDWLFIGGPMSLPQMLLSNKSVERRHFPQTITATSSHKRVIGHSSWWEIDHLRSLWGYQISLGLDIICRYVLLSWFPSDQKARIGLCGVRWSIDGKPWQSKPYPPFWYINHRATWAQKASDGVMTTPLTH